MKRTNREASLDATKMKLVARADQILASYRDERPAATSATAPTDSASESQAPEEIDRSIDARFTDFTQFESAIT